MAAAMFITMAKAMRTSMKMAVPMATAVTQATMLALANMLALATFGTFEKGLPQKGLDR